MSYAASLSPPLPIFDCAFAETTHVLQRAGVAGMFGLGAGPLFLRRSRPKRPPTWRMSMLGSSALVSVSVPFLCMERLSYHSIMSTVDLTSQPDMVRYALYASHTLGTVLGAGILHVVRKSRGRFHVPIQVLAPMLCKAQLETILLKNERYWIRYNNSTTLKEIGGENTANTMPWAYTVEWWISYFVLHMCCGWRWRFSWNGLLAIECKSRKKWMSTIPNTVHGDYEPLNNNAPKKIRQFTEDNVRM